MTTAPNTPAPELDDWEDSTICRSCNADVYPKKLIGSGYCQACLNDAYDGIDDYDEWDDDDDGWEEAVTDEDWPEGK